MEGFDPKAMNEIFRAREIIEADEEMVVAVALGHRKDETAFNKSERKPFNDFVKVAA